MNTKKLFVVLSAVACWLPCLQAAAPQARPPHQAPAASGAKPYIPVISKGFQHQFWQAVKLGPKRLPRT